MFSTIKNTLIITLISAVILSTQMARPALAEGPYIAARYAMGVELELFMGDFGIFGGIMEDWQMDISATCQPVQQEKYYGARHFFNKGGDGWYAGAAYSVINYLNKEGCTKEEQQKDMYESGGMPVFGYYWQWDSGFNIDLGLRPGVLALGMAF